MREDVSDIVGYHSDEEPEGRRTARRKRTGKYVETKNGVKGITKNSDPLVNGKVLVYLEDGSKVICKPKNLKITGYYD